MGGTGGNKKGTSGPCDNGRVAAPKSGKRESQQRSSSILRDHVTSRSQVRSHKLKRKASRRPLNFDFVSCGWARTHGATRRTGRRWAQRPEKCRATRHSIEQGKSPDFATELRSHIPGEDQSPSLHEDVCTVRKIGCARIAALVPEPVYSPVRQSHAPSQRELSRSRAKRPLPAVGKAREVHV